MTALASAPRERADYTVFISTDGSTWHNLCTQMVSVRVEEQRREVAVTHTACSGALVTVAGRGAVAIHLRFLFTELTAAALGAWTLLRTQWESDTPTIYLRYQPRKSESGDTYYYQTADGDGDVAAGQLAALLYPEGEGLAAPFIAGCTVVCANLARVAV